MAYIINKTNGSKLVTIEDGSINVSACDLTLVGKNYAGYGESIASNFVKLLENFSSPKQPLKPLTGQLWYDSANKKVKFYNGAEFKSIPSLQASADYPTDQLKGDLHYNETEGKLYYYDGSKHILIGPQLSGKAATNTVSPGLLLGDDDLQRYVLTNQIQNFYDETEVSKVAITSDESFAPASEDYSVRFPVIKQGITLSNADPSTGISASSPTSGYIFWGTAADSLRLEGRLASEYVRYENPNFTSLLRVNSQDGINISSNSLKLFTNANGAQISSSEPRISFTVYNGIELVNVVNIDASDNLALLPSRTLGEVVNIGNASNPFNVVYARTYNTVGADLAEKYLADAEYEPGTVLRLGGTAEVTICASYEHEGIAGIVTTDPGYVLNQGLENGVAIALKGRVPCKVKGPVKKGDVLVSSSTPGHAEVRKYGHRTNPLAVLGKALQDFEGETGIIEVMVW